MSSPLGSILSVDHYRQVAAETNAKIKYLIEAVKSGMEPWEPAHIDICTDFDIDYYRYRVMLDASGPGWHFGYIHPVEVADVDQGEDWFWELYPQIVKAFRLRETWPIEDNIILGEN